MSGQRPPNAGSQRRIDPDEYTEDYYLKSCEGFDLFTASKGTRLSPRLEHALDLAAILPGHHVLDIACGRGEVVLHASLRGAQAVGIDYSAPAAALAGRLLRSSATKASARASAIRMDATRLAFPSGAFDTVFMLDFVEHVYPEALERVFDETLRVLKPSGRLIIHTSPNRTFESVVYPRYVRQVHRLVLALSRRVGYKDGLINPLMLPTDPEPPHDDYERRLHVNEQTAGGMCEVLGKRGFQSLKADFWEPPAGPLFMDKRLQVELHILDFIRFLRPLSRFWPLSRFFSTHIWIVAQRPA